MSADVLDGERDRHGDVAGDGAANGAMLLRLLHESAHQ